ncbi:MAG TPA: FxsA family protein [Actinomycetes bacterium]|nr:FxsA family protein [Actinomycetes bacterium]
MALLIVLLLIVVPILELYVGSLVVDEWGFGPALLALLGGAIVGILVIRASWRRRPRGADNGLLFLAGLLLLFPGYVSDVLGLILLLPPVRAVLKVWIGSRVERTLSSMNLTVLRWDDATGRLRRTDYGRGDVVSGEVIDDQPLDTNNRPELD